MNNREQMLKNIGIVDFVAVELSLYLDTHPHDRGAMEYYNHYNRIRNQMKKDFSKKYYPLTTELVDCDCNQSWSWGEAPLPWEGVCG